VAEQPTSLQAEAKTVLASGQTSGTFRTGTNVEKHLNFWESLSGIPHEKARLLIPKRLYNKAFTEDFIQSYGASASERAIFQSLINPLFYKLGMDIVTAPVRLEHAENVVSLALNKIVSQLEQVPVIEQLSLVLDFVARIKDDLDNLTEYIPGIDNYDPETLKEIIKEQFSQIKHSIEDKEFLGALEDKSFRKTLVEEIELIDYMLSDVLLNELQGQKTKHFLDIKDTFHGILELKNNFFEQIFIPDPNGKVILLEEHFGKNPLRFMLEKDIYTTKEDEERALQKRLAQLICLGIFDSKPSIFRNLEFPADKIDNLPLEEVVVTLINNVRLAKIASFSENRLKKYLSQIGSTPSHDKIANILNESYRVLQFLEKDISNKIIISILLKEAQHYPDPYISSAFQRIMRNGVTFYELREIYYKDIEGSLFDTFKREKLDKIVDRVINLDFYSNECKDYLERVLEIKKVLVPHSSDDNGVGAVKDVISWYLKSHPGDRDKITSFLDPEFSPEKLKRYLDEKFLDIQDVLLLTKNSIAEILNGNEKLGLPPQRDFFYQVASIHKVKKSADIKTQKKRSEIVEELQTIEQIRSYARKNMTITQTYNAWSKSMFANIDELYLDLVTEISVGICVNFEVSQMSYDVAIKKTIEFLVVAGQEVDKSNQEKFIECQAYALKEMYEYLMPSTKLFDHQPREVLALLLFKVAEELGRVYDQVYDFGVDEEYMRTSGLFKCLGVIIGTAFNDRIFKEKIIEPRDLIPENPSPFSFTAYLSKIFSVFSPVEVRRR
jgi:hypothetical protein